MSQPSTKTSANALKALLAAVSIPEGQLTTCSQAITASGTPQTVTPASMNGITTGMSLAIDIGPDQELVTVTATTGGTFTAIFSQNHLTTPWVIATPAYNTIKLGPMQDPTDAGNMYAAVTLIRRKTVRMEAGWRVNSKPILEIETGILLTNANTEVVEGQLMDVADALSRLFVERFALNGAQNVIVTLVDMDDTALYKEFPNGQVYRIHLTYVEPVQQYNVTPTA